VLDLTIEQRLSLAEKAQEILREGLLQTVMQELTGNYIEQLKNLAPENNMGREHLTSRICVLGDVILEIIGELEQRAGDGHLALQQMKQQND